MEAQHRNAPLIDEAGVELAIGIGVWDHLAAPGESEIGAVLLPQALFQRESITFAVVAGIVEHANSRHVASAPQFDVIAAREIVFPIKLPPRHIHVQAADSIVVVWFDLFHTRNEPTAIAADRIHEIPAHGAGGVRESI